MESTTPNNNTPLKTATQLATITLAVLAVLTTFGAVLVFVIHSVIATDVSPRLERLEIAVGDLSGRIEQIDSRIDGLDSRIDGLDNRMETLEQGQQRIIELLTAGRR